MAAKKLPKINLADLKKRCPPNQKKDFQKFLDKNNEYQKRVNKYPEKLPRIDWEFYRSNVRTSHVDMVNQFEEKYKELNKVFDSRFEMDLSHYYKEIEKQREIMEKDYCDYVEESNKRIAEYEKEMELVRAMKPYEDMTMEEFCEAKHNPFVNANGTPSFWPHRPEEQTPGPSGTPIGHDEEDLSKPLLTKEALEQHEQMVKSAEGVTQADFKDVKAEVKADQNKVKEAAKEAKEVKMESKEVKKEAKTSKEDKTDKSVKKDDKGSQKDDTPDKE